MICCDFHHSTEEKVSWQNLNPDIHCHYCWCFGSGRRKGSVFAPFSSYESLCGYKKELSFLSASQKWVSTGLELADLFFLQFFFRSLEGHTMASLPVSIPARQCPFNYCIALPPSILSKPESEHSLGLLAEFLVFHHLGSYVIDLFVHTDYEQIRPKIYL